MVIIENVKEFVIFKETIFINQNFFQGNSSILRLGKVRFEKDEIKLEQFTDFENPESIQSWFVYSNGVFFYSKVGNDFKLIDENFRTIVNIFDSRIGSVNLLRDKALIYFDYKLGEKYFNRFKITDLKKTEEEVLLDKKLGGRFIYWIENMLVFSGIRRNPSYPQHLINFHAVDDISGELVWYFDIEDFTKYEGGGELRLTKVYGIVEDRMYVKVTGEKRSGQKAKRKPFYFSFNIHTGKEGKRIIENAGELEEEELKLFQHKLYHAQLIEERKCLYTMLDNYLWEFNPITGKQKIRDFSEEYNKRKISKEGRFFSLFQDKFYFISSEYIKGVFYPDSLYDEKGMYEKDPYYVFSLVELDDKSEKIRTLELTGLRSVNSALQFVNNHVLLLDFDKNLHAFSLDGLS